MKSEFKLKTLTIVASMLLYAQFLVAQSDTTANRKKSRQYLGVQVGYTVSDMYGGNVDLYLSKSGAKYQNPGGLAVSITFKNEFNRLLYLKLGVDYLKKQASITGTSFANDFKADVGFLQLPILLGFQPVNFRKSGNVNMSVESGISLNFKTSGTDSFQNGLHPDNKVTRNNPVKAFVIGGVFEIRASQKVIVVFTYRFTRDLDSYFFRRYTVKTGPNFSQETYYDYDVWIKSYSTTAGVNIKL